MCDDLYYGSASQLLGSGQRQDPRDTGLWRWRVAWVIDLGFDVMETATFFLAEIGDNGIQTGAR